MFPSTRGGERGGESREFHRVGTGESSPSTTTNTNSSFATCLPQIGHLQKYVDQKLVETSVNFLFFRVKPNYFRFVNWFISILKPGLPKLSFEVFQTKTKTELF